MFVCMSDDRIRLYQGRNRIRLKTFVGSSQRCKHKHDECTQRRLHSKYHVNITLTGNVFLEWRVQIPSYHICNMIKRHFTIWEQNAESLQACENVFSSGWSISSVYWSTSASIKQLHHYSWDVRSRLSNRQPMSPPLCNTRRPGSSTNQAGRIRKKKFLCVWSAAVELTTTDCPDCPWCIIDTDSVLHTIEDFSVFQSIRDIVIAPLCQFWL